MIEPEVLLNFIKDRRSIRQFQEKDIPPEEIEMIKLKKILEKEKIHKIMNNTRPSKKASYNCEG